MAEPNHNDVPDSTDWLPTPLSGLAAVEAALRCQVCKDFYKTPMLTSCSHTFCSLCIRRALSNDGKCPLCRASEQELKLRSNWSMEEVVEAFVKSRTALLDIARTAGQPARLSPKRKATEDGSYEADAPDSKRLRNSARLSRARGEEATAAIMREESDLPDPLEDEDPSFDDDGLVPCPSCQSRMKQWQVFKHLDICPGPVPRRSNGGGDSSRGIITPTSFDQPLRSLAKNLERLPALNYSMLKEPALRKKLSELGISTAGSRPLLEKRHKEWITIWNANCDSARPKRRPELLHDLEIWEKTQGGRVQVFGQPANNATVVRDKDFDGAAWAARHDTSFKDLIAAARKTRAQAQQVTENSRSLIEEQQGHTGDNSKINSVGSGQGDVPLPEMVDLTEHEPDGANMEMGLHERDNTTMGGLNIGSVLPDRHLPSGAYFMHDGFSDPRATNVRLGTSSNDEAH